MTKAGHIIKKVAIANNNGIPLDRAIKHFCFIYGANLETKKQVAEFYGYAIK